MKKVKMKRKMKRVTSPKTISQMVIIMRLVPLYPLL